MPSERGHTATSCSRKFTSSRVAYAQTLEESVAERKYSHADLRTGAAEVSSRVKAVPLPPADTISKPASSTANLNRQI